MLLSDSATKVAYQVKTHWGIDIDNLSDEVCGEVLDNSKPVSPKLSDVLNELYIVHRAYLTLIRLSKFRPNHILIMCSLAPGTFFHLLWTCANIQGFWTQVVRILLDTMGSPLTLHPRQCLLGLNPNPVAENL